MPSLPWNPLHSSGFSTRLPGDSIPLPLRVLMCSSKAVNGANILNQYPPSSFLPYLQYLFITVIILTPELTRSINPHLSRPLLLSLTNRPSTLLLPLPRYLYQVHFLLPHTMPTILQSHSYHPLCPLVPTHTHFNDKIPCHQLRLRAPGLIVIRKLPALGV